jgi:hypothetical protein
MAKCVAAELEKYFGFVGYPSIFHTGMFIIAFPQSNTLTSNYHLTKMYSFISFQTNGKEFIATVVVELLKANNPNCFLVTGRPRTPRDQGSVENANKLVQRVLKSISTDRCLKGLEVNWTNLLGEIMAVCNSQTGMKSNSTSSYEAVFGQRYHPVLQSTVTEMRDCVSIFQRLELSPDKRLEKYVKDHDIVDIDDADARGHNVQIIEEDSNDLDDADESEGDDINNDTFPDCEKEDEIVCQEITVTKSNIGNTMAVTSENANEFPDEIPDVDNIRQTIQRWRRPSSNSETF